MEQITQTRCMPQLTDSSFQSLYNDSMNKHTKIINVDLATENLLDAIIDLKTTIPDSFVRIVDIATESTGWPNIDIVFNESDSEILAEWLGQEDDMEFFMESLSDF